MVVAYPSGNLGQFLVAPVRAKNLRSVGRRRSRSGIGLGEDLERRIVLSDLGGNLLGSALNAIGVVTGPVSAPTTSTSSGQTSQLQTDVQALQTELASLAAKSGVTVADLTSLAVRQPGAGAGWPDRRQEPGRRRKRAGHGDRGRDVDDAGADGLRGGICQHERDAGDDHAGVHRPEQGDHRLGGDQHRSHHRRRRSGRHPDRSVQHPGR